VFSIVVLMFALKTSAASDLASFPGLLHLQFSIAFSVIRSCTFSSSYVSSGCFNEFYVVPPKSDILQVTWISL